MISSTSHRRGFTIVELLVVIVVIGILAAVTIVAYNGIQARARASNVQGALAQVNKKLAAYTVDNNSAFPTSLSLIGVNDTADVTFQYSYNNTVNPATYCVTATISTTSYKADSSATQPASGGCPGHGVGGVAAITNLTVDPRATSVIIPAASVGWGNGRWFGTSGSGTHTLVTGAGDGPLGITSYLRKAWAVSPTGNGDTGFQHTGGGSAATTTLGYPITAGTPYNVSSYVRSSAAGQIAHTQMYFHDGAGAIVAATVTASNYTLVANTWTRVTGSATAPAGAVTLDFVTDVDGGTVWAPGTNFDATALMVTTGATLYNYTDPILSPATWVWNGTTNASTSTGVAP